MTGTPLLITADDFGLTVGISEAIIEAGRSGVVTGTSVLAVGPALPSVEQLLRDQDAIDVGAHLALVGEDPPLLSSREIPSLVDRRGRFPLSWRHLLLRAHALDPADVRREWSAQLERVRATGASLTHLDTHQHVHLLPQLADVLVRLAEQHDIATVRAPRSGARSPAGLAIDLLADRLRRTIDAHGITTTDDFAGLRFAGSMDRAHLDDELHRLASRRPRSAEINVHPGSAFDPDRRRYRWGYDWSVELDTLTDATTKQRISASGFRPARRSELVDVRP